MANHSTAQTNPLCPRCKKKRMCRNGKRRRPDGELVQQWVCRSKDREGSSLKVCYATLYPDQPVRKPDGKPSDEKQIKPRKKFRRKIDLSRMMVFTAAQNATPTHPFFSALKVFAKEQNAELCVIPLNYKNATSVWTASQRNAAHWLRDVAEAELLEEGITQDNYIRLTDMSSWEALLDVRAASYLYEQRRKLNSNLVVVGEMKTQPTAADPLTGVDSMTRGESGIFGHTKVRMKCVATPQNRLPKILTTTGACTVPNYSDTKAGQKGKFHHVLGAVVVEIKNDKVFHLHHINARNDGAFIFIDTEYHPDGKIKKAGPSKALVMGDAHYRFADPAVVDATFGRNGKTGLVNVLQAQELLWHDLLDCYWGNPHNSKNPFITIAKHRAAFHLAREEVQETVAWAEELGAGRKNLIVASNHDDMFARWIIREDWKEHPDNAEFYLETALQMARSAKMAESGAQYLDPFGYWVTQLKSPNSDITPLLQNQSYTIGDIECSLHGDKGPRGARGTVGNLSNIGVKVITGHGHSPAIFNGHYRTGTMTRPTAEYVDGPNDWLNAHVNVDAWDKRHHYFCIDGSFGFGID